MTVARRVLLLGLGGADWSLLRPLLDSGQLPCLAGLIERAASGQVRSLQPQFDPLLWTSVATGRRADAHRVIDAATIGPEGQPHPLSALTRRVPALWNLLAGARLLCFRCVLPAGRRPVRSPDPARYGGLTCRTAVWITRPQTLAGPAAGR